MRDEDPERFGSRILTELAPRLGRVVSRALESDLEEPITVRQYMILEWLTEHPYRTSDLAERNGVSIATTSKAVGSLEARGWVKRDADASDGRATLLAITEKGSRGLATAHERVLDRFRIVTAEMTAEDADALRLLQPVLLAGLDRLRERNRATARSVER